MERVNIYQNEAVKTTREKYIETNDCTVVSMMNVLNISYSEAHKILRMRWDRKHRKGVYMKDLELKLTEYKVVKGPYDRNNRITINQFVKKHPVGRFYVCVSGHALSIIDGVVYDHTDKPRRLINRAWRVYV